MKKISKRLRFVVIGLCLVMIYTSLEPYNWKVYAQDEEKEIIKEQVTSKEVKEEPVKKFTEELKELENLLDGIEKDLEEGKDIIKKLDELKVKATEIKETNDKIHAKFKETEEFLKEKNLQEALQRHYEFVKECDKKFQKLNNELKEILTTKDKQELKGYIKKTKEFIKGAKPQKKEKPIEPKRLPHRIAPVKEIPVIEQEERPIHEIPLIPEIKPIEPKGKGKKKQGGFLFKDKEAIMLVRAGLSDYDTFYLVQANIPFPQDMSDYLKETPDVKITPEIKKLATETLKSNPLLIYEYVRNNFEYEPYYGSLKGSQQTLLERGGNDVDLASLLIALYRAANIPARYVHAQVEIPIEQMMNLLGVKDPLTAGNIIATAGYPSKAIVIGGKIQYIWVDHIWVEIYVPYLPDEGVSIERGKKMWIPVDPSFKQYEEKESVVDISTQIQFNPDEYLSHIQFLPPTFQYFEQLTAATDKPLPDILKLRMIKPEKLGILTAALPYRCLTTTPERYAVIPDNLRHKISISVSGLNYSTNIAQITNKRMTISYIPASDYDEMIVQVYGGLYATPAYLIRVRPVLKIEGDTVASGIDVKMGSEQTLSLIFTSPALNMPEDRIEDIIEAGTYLSIGIDALRIPQNVYTQREEKIRQLYNKTINELINIGDDGIGELLYFTCLNYHNQVNLSEEMINPLIYTVSIKHPAEAKTKLALAIDYLFGVPYTVSIEGIAFDVGRLIYSPFGIKGEKEKIRQFMLISGYTSSFYEHKVLEIVYDAPAISCVKAIQYANEQGITVFDITKENIDTVLPRLQVSDSVKQEIQNLINAGLIVKIPQRNINYQGWIGVGYIVMDPVTFAAAYKISGGLAGGYVWIQIDLLHWIRAPKEGVIYGGPHTGGEIIFRPLDLWFNARIADYFWIAGYRPVLNDREPYSKSEFLEEVSRLAPYLFYFVGHGRGNIYMEYIEDGRKRATKASMLLVDPETDVWEDNITPFDFKEDYRKLVFLNACESAGWQEEEGQWVIKDHFAKAFGINTSPDSKEAFIGWVGKPSWVASSEAAFWFWRIMVIRNEPLYIAVEFSLSLAERERALIQIFGDMFIRLRD